MFDQSGWVRQNLLVVDDDEGLHSCWVAHRFLFLSLFCENISFLNTVSALAYIENTANSAHLRPYVATKDFHGLLGWERLRILGYSLSWLLL